MRKLIAFAAVVAVAASGPALAKPGQGNGHGKSHTRSVGHVNGDHGRKDDRGAYGSRSRQRALVDRNHNGVADSLERRGNRAANRYGGAACPPGLAKKSPTCVSPGQAKRTFAEGQRVPRGYNQYTAFDRIPAQYRDDVPDNFRSDAYRYIYRDDSVYVVDRSSNIVRSIISQFD